MKDQIVNRFLSQLLTAVETMQQLQDQQIEPEDFGTLNQTVFDMCVSLLRNYQQHPGAPVTHVKLLIPVEDVNGNDQSMEDK